MGTIANNANGRQKSFPWALRLRLLKDLFDWMLYSPVIEIKGAWFKGWVGGGNVGSPSQVLLLGQAGKTILPTISVLTHVTFFHQTFWPPAPIFMPYACLWFWGLLLHWRLVRIIDISSSLWQFTVLVLVACPSSRVTLFGQNKQFFGNSCSHCAVWLIILIMCFSTLRQYRGAIYFSMFTRRFH